MFWILSAAMAIVTLVAILMPLWRSTRQLQSESAFDALIYKRQLTELDHDVEAGLISTEQAQSARAEIARRLLTADSESERENQTPSTPNFGRTQKIPVILVVCAILPGIAFAIYLKNGSPGMSDQAYVSRCADVPEKPQIDAEVNTVIDCLALRMAANPDAEGLALLARSYLTRNRFEEAADAYARAIEIAGPQAGLLEGLGLAVIFANGGLVTDMARDAFTIALQNDPNAVWSKFYLAEYDFQQGRKSEAIRSWIDLLEVSSENPRFQKMVDERVQNGLAVLAEEQGVSLEQLEDPANIAQPDQPSSLDDVSEEQMTMIRGMVDGLAARLEKEPKDLEGWLRLMRSYVVLKEDTNARKTAQKATMAFLTDRDALEAIVALSEELGLTAGPKVNLPNALQPEAEATTEGSDRD